MALSTLALCISGNRASTGTHWGVKVAGAAIAVGLFWAVALITSDPIHGAPLPPQVGIAGVCVITIAAFATTRSALIVAPIMLVAGALLAVHYNNLIRSPSYSGSTAIASLTDDWSQETVRTINLQLKQIQVPPSPGILTDAELSRLGLSPEHVRLDLKVATVRRRWFTFLTGLYEVAWKSPVIRTHIDEQSGSGAAAVEGWTDADE